MYQFVFIQNNVQPPFLCVAYPLQQLSLCDMAEEAVMSYKNSLITVSCSLVVTVC